MSEALITVEEAAVHTHLSRDTIYRMVAREEIPHLRIGRMIRFTISSLDAWLASCMKAAKEPATPPTPEPPAPLARGRGGSRAARSPGLVARTVFPEGYEPIRPVPRD